MHTSAALWVQGLDIPVLLRFQSILQSLGGHWRQRLHKFLRLPYNRAVQELQPQTAVDYHSNTMINPYLLINFESKNPIERTIQYRPIPSRIILINLELTYYKFIEMISQIDHVYYTKTPALR